MAAPIAGVPPLRRDEARIASAAFAAREPSRDTGSAKATVATLLSTAIQAAHQHP